MAGEIPIRLEPFEIDWNFEMEGRSWNAAEARPRYELTPEKLEMFDGKLLGYDEDRLKLLGLLLENCGLRAAVHMGGAAQWQQAVAELADDALNFQFTLRRVHRLWDLTDEGANPEDVARYYQRWTTPDFVEVDAEGAARSREERIAATPAEYDWDHWTEWTTWIESVESRTDGASVVAARTRLERNRLMRPVKKSLERWQEEWRNADGWKIASRKFLSVEDVSDTDGGD